MSGRPRLGLGWASVISQAAQCATARATQCGIAGLTLTPGVARVGIVALIPAPWHQPRRRRRVLPKNAPPVTRVLRRALDTSAAPPVMKRNGSEMLRE